MALPVVATAGGEAVCGGIGIWGNPLRRPEGRHTHNLQLGSGGLLSDASWKQAFPGSLGVLMQALATLEGPAQQGSFWVTPLCHSADVAPQELEGAVRCPSPPNKAIAARRAASHSQ